MRQTEIVKKKKKNEMRTGTLAHFETRSKKRKEKI